MKARQVKGTRARPVPKRATPQYTPSLKSFPITISLDRATLERLDALAQVLGGSRSFTVREAVTYYIEQHAVLFVSGGAK